MDISCRPVWITFTESGTATSRTGSVVATNGSDTLRGVSTQWWELSLYAYTHIAVASARLAVKSILGDSIIVLSAVYPTGSGTYPCTLLTSAGEVVNLGLAADPFVGGTKTADELNDTLVIVDQTGRKLKYKSGGVSTLTASPTMTLDGVLYNTPYNGHAGIIKSPYDLPATGWWELQLVTGALKQKRNIALYVQSVDPGAVYFYTDSLMRSARVVSYKYIGFPVWDTIARGIIRRRDTYNLGGVPRYTGTGSDLVYKVMIDSVTSTTFPNDTITWAASQFDYLTGILIINRGGGPWAYYNPLRMSRSNGRRAIVVDYYNQSVTPAAGDSFYVLQVKRSAPPAATASAASQTTYKGVFRAGTARFGYYNDKTLTLSGQYAPDSIAQIINVATDDRAAITGCITIGNYIFIHKSGSDIYQAVLNDAGLIDEIAPTGSSASAVGQPALAQWGGRMLYIGRQGFYSGIGASTEDLSIPIKRYWTDSISPNGIAGAALTVFKNRAYLAVPVGGTVNSRVLVYDLVSQQWMKYHMAAGGFISWRSSFTGDDSLVFYSPPNADSGRVFLYGGATKDTGAFISSYYKMGWLPLDQSQSMVSLWRYGLDHYRSAAGNVVFTAKNDSAGFLAETPVVTDTIAYSAGRWSRAVRPFKQTRPGSTWQFTLSANNADSVWISRMELEFIPRSARPRWK